MDEFTILNHIFSDDEETMAIQFIIDSNQILIQLLTTLLPRDHVPRIQNFAEETVPRFSTKDFRNSFRIDRTTFEIVLQEVAPLLQSDQVGGKEQIAVDKQLMVFIWYLSNQESMRETSNLFGMSISTVHATILRVCRHFNTAYRNLLHWLDPARQNDIATNFQLTFGIPGVIGIIDGTHVRLSAPIGGDQDFINRKGFASVVLQIVVDCDLLITSAYVGWPGCTHDGRVLRNSQLFHRAEMGNINRDKHLLGDSAYPLKEWVITPFRDNGHLNQQKTRFNRTVSSCRQTVERAIGHVKGRFRRLREITLHNVEDICYEVLAGCRLHNLCIIHEDNIDDFIQNDDHQHPNNYPNIFGNAPNGIAKRNNLMNAMP